MNIDTKFFGAVIFLLAQAIAAVIWGASLSAEVSRLSVLQDKANETASIDVIAFRLDDLTKEIEDMKELDREIIKQHEKLFSILGNQAQSGGSSAYGNY
tara:strand:+ start:665 stop:961 length:297 start_codon:yes stop_codon:yes gene_type:complete